MLNGETVMAFVNCHVKWRNCHGNRLNCHGKWRNCDGNRELSWQTVKL